MPVFEAWRLDVDPKLADDRTNLPAAGVWHWIGHPETLGRYEIDTQEGDPVSPPAFRRAMRGRGAKTAKPVRRSTNLTRGGKSSVGLRCVRGGYEPSEGLAAECRAAATDKRREELRARLVAEAGTGIEQLAGTGRFAAAATVTGLGEGGGAVVRVEWVAFGAEGKKGLVSPFANRKVARTFEAAVAKVSDRLGKTFGDKEKSAEVEAPEAVVEPAPEAAATPGDARLPGLLSTPVRDSLGANIDVIGENAAQNIRRRAERKAKQHKLDRLPEEDLRRLLDNSENPFDKMPGGPGPDGEALSGWWADNSDRILLTTAIEGTLAAKAEKRFADLAKREVARRGVLSPAPLEAVREERGKKFASEVGRRAAVRTGELASMPEKERMARTRELHERIKGVGLRGANLEDLAESVALQHLRNAHNEHEAQLIEREAELPEQAVVRERKLAAAGAGIGMD